MNLVFRARNMIVRPKAEWDVIAGETPGAKSIVVNYIIPLTLMAAIAAFVGFGFISLGNFSLSLGIYYALQRVVVNILTVYITAFVVDLLAPSFGSEKNFGRSLQLVSFGATPAFIGSLFAIIPFLLRLVLVAGGLYSIYLWYLGVGPIKKTPEDKKVAYLLVSFFVLIIVYAIVIYLLLFLLLPVLGLGIDNDLD
jgi:hypothetical protein